MNFKKIQYTELNARQKEVYNFQKLAAVLADYGFNCIKLSDDWQGADFLAYHKDGNDTLRVQLKARLTIARKYMGKNLFVAFPLQDSWYLIDHDELVSLMGEHTDRLESRSWQKDGLLHSAKPSQKLINSIEKYMLYAT